MERVSPYLILICFAGLFTSLKGQSLLNQTSYRSYLNLESVTTIKDAEDVVTRRTIEFLASYFLLNKHSCHLQ